MTDIISKSQADLVDEIIRITGNDQSKDQIAKLLQDRGVRCDLIQDWSEPNAFDSIPTGYPDKPTGSAPAPDPQAHSITFYSKAPKADVIEALKRIGIDAA